MAIEFPQLKKKSVFDLPVHPACSAFWTFQAEIKITVWQKATEFFL